MTRSKTVTNKEYDEIGENLEAYIEEELGESMNNGQCCALINIGLRTLGMKKE